MATWTIPPDVINRRMKGDLSRAVRAISLELYARILVRSPVDTGRFRGNWSIGVGVVPRGADQPPDPTGAAALGEAPERLSGWRPGQTIHFRNNLPYSVRLEYGHSKQAPAGVVRVTLAEIGAISSRVAARARRSRSEEEV